MRAPVSYFAMSNATLTAHLDSSEFDASNLLVVGVRGRERIAELYWFEVDVVLPASGLLTEELPEQLIPGAALTLLLSRALASSTEVRRVHGVVEWIRDRLDAIAGRRSFTLRLVPSLADLALVVTQEAHVGQTVPAILAEKLDLHGIGADRVTMGPTGYPARELIVQYKESDLAFVCRLGEHAGVSFLFEHPEKGPERVIFSDHPAESGLTLPEELETFTYHGGGNRDGVFFLEIERRRIPSTYVVQDYNYRTPLTDINGACSLASTDPTQGHGGGLVEYASHHVDATEGGGLARVRAEEHLAAQELWRGKSVLPLLSAGHTPTLTDHPMLADTQLLIVEVEHTASFSVEPSTPNTYENSFVAIPATRRFRPPRTTPRPRIHGLVTGTIALGAATAGGGAAQLDDDGRYRVHFHFDTVPESSTTASSHPIRMAQSFAGFSHGMHFPLRPGSEVVLAFLDGDPDRPIIVGGVPNTIAPSPTTSSNSNKNRITTTAGVLIEIGEGR
jgi:type VI secretion system secreted protein VgrG